MMVVKKKQVAPHVGTIKLKNTQQPGRFREHRTQTFLAQQMGLCVPTRILPKEL